MNLLWSPVNLIVNLAHRDGASTFAIAAVRWTTLALLLGLLLATPWFRGLTGAKWPGRRDGLTCVVLGLLLFGPSHALYYFAITKTSSFEGTALGTTAPIWVALLSFFFLREHIGWARAISIVIGFVGAYLVSVGFQLPSLSQGHTFGNSLYLLAVFMECIAGVWSIHIARRTSGITVLWLQILGAAVFMILGPVLFPTALAFSISGTGLTFWACIGYLVVFSGLITFSVWYTLAERAPLSLMVVTILMQPPLAALLGVWFLGETVTVNVAVGTGLILAALALSAFGNRSVTETPPTVAEA
ncbi:MAG: DMT family transporter [Fimbriimonadaceae bacterium]|nr:DMT family transporter [Fimbriimonadaceae bacterium]